MLKYLNQPKLVPLLTIPGYACTKKRIFPNLQQGKHWAPNPKDFMLSQYQPKSPLGQQYEKVYDQ